MFKISSEKTDNSSSNNQFVKLYYDSSHTQLFGWLCTFSDPRNPSDVIELWSLVDAETIDFSGVRYYPVMITDENIIPDSIDSWYELLLNHTEFNAFIYRLASLDTSAENVSIAGKLVYGIYNEEPLSNKKELVSVVLQTQPELYEADTKRFNQVSLMTTMEAQLPRFLYTETLNLPQALPSEIFIQNKGIEGLHLNKSANTIVMLEEVITQAPATLSSFMKEVLTIHE